MSGNLDAFDKLVSQDIVDHDAAPEQAIGGPGPLSRVEKRTRSLFCRRRVPQCAGEGRTHGEIERMVPVD